MFFRLPVVRFFNRVINRAMVTVALVLLQIGWLLWAFFSLTAGKGWVNAGLNVLSLFITLYLVRKDENSDDKIIWLVLIVMMPPPSGCASGCRRWSASTPPTSPSSRARPTPSTPPAGD